MVDRTKLTGLVLLFVAIVAFTGVMTWAGVKLMLTAGTDVGRALLGFFLAVLPFITVRGQIDGRNNG